MDAAVAPLLDARRRGGPAHLVRVASLSGFGLRDASQGAVVAPGVVSGRLLAGLADDELRRAVDEGRRVVSASIGDDAADGAGLVCGGVATLVLTPLAELPEELFGWLAEARPVALITAGDDNPGAMAVTDRHQAGSLGDPHLDGDVIARCRKLLAGGRSDGRLEDLGDRSLLISVVVPQPRVLVVGTGPMVDAIDAQVRLLGWSGAACDDAATALTFLDQAGPADAVIVLSHDAAVDTPVLARAADSSVGYVGAMGSRSTQAARRRRLIDGGVAPERLTRIHGPIGLDLGSRSPAETAVAIVAEVLAQRSGRTPGSLAGAAGPING